MPVWVDSVKPVFQWIRRELWPWNIWEVRKNRLKSEAQTVSDGTAHEAGQVCETQGLLIGYIWGSIVIVLLLNHPAELTSSDSCRWISGEMGWDDDFLGKIYKNQEDFERNPLFSNGNDPGQWNDLKQSSLGRFPLGIFAK